MPNLLQKNFVREKTNNVQFIKAAFVSQARQLSLSKLPLFENDLFRFVRFTLFPISIRKIPRAFVFVRHRFFFIFEMYENAFCRAVRNLALCQTLLIRAEFDVPMQLSNCVDFPKEMY